jgi:hypothetical protein
VFRFRERGRAKKPSVQVYFLAKKLTAPEARDLENDESWQRDAGNVCTKGPYTMGSSLCQIRSAYLLCLSRAPPCPCFRVFAASYLQDAKAQDAAGGEPSGEDPREPGKSDVPGRTCNWQTAKPRAFPPSEATWLELSSLLQRHSYRYPPSGLALELHLELTGLLFNMDYDPDSGLSPRFAPFIGMVRYQVAARC